MDDTPLCPNCNVNLLANDFYDCDNEVREVIESWYGFCPNCQKEFTWKKVYIFSHFEKIEPYNENTT